MGIAPSFLFFDIDSINLSQAILSLINIFDNPEDD
jgi:hypothetical protein